MILLPEGFNFSLLVSDFVTVALPFVGIAVLLAGYLIYKKAVNSL